MARMSTQALKKLVALVGLAVSFIIALVGFYMVLTKWAQGGDSTFPMFLSIIMAILLLLIMAMMLKVLGDLRKISEKEQEP